MKILYMVVALSVLCLFVLLIESKRERRNFVVTDYKINVPQMVRNQKVKVVVLSDLHNKVYGQNNCELIDTIRKLEPDGIIVGGDMLIAKRGHTPEVAIELMREMIKIAPIYCANGNHEQRMKEKTEIYGSEYVRYKNELEKLGVVILENETRCVKIGTMNYWISGLEIPSQFYERCKYEVLEKTKITELIGEKKQEGYHILLAHNPVHSKVYAKWGADLVISGHLHGGIIRLPYLGGMITPQVHLLPKHSGGRYQEGDTQIIVSKGLGEHTVKIRFLNNPELIVLHMARL